MVSLISTETTHLTGITGNSTASGLALEEEMHRRAEAMTTVLSKIMDQPAAPRFWGLNE